MQTQYHILIVDDEIKICKLLQEILQKEGYIADYRTNGMDGLLYTKKYSVDLIILDLYMHGLNGIQFIHQLQQSNRTIGFIVFTGWNLSDRLYQQLRGMVDLIIDKPVDLKKITHAVSDLLSTSKGTN
ncbi:MAG: response regulator [Caldithrix sp.]|nr:response regulator [Caldithrix sp.]